MRTGPLILLVEDSLPDAELVQQALKDADPPCDFVVERTGEDAMRYLFGKDNQEPSRRPDLVLLDLNLPGANGRELLLAIRQDPRLRSLPVVVLTTSESPFDLEDAYRSQANSYITKPAGYERFSAALRCFHEYWFRVATLPDARSDRGKP